MRLFVGLPVPSELAQALVRLTRAIELPQSRRTSAENIHLTLAFLGEVTEVMAASVERELTGMIFAPLHLKLTALNTFQRAGILIAEIEPAPALLQLQTKVVDSMARCGLPPQDRPYHPHLTLARFRGRLRPGKSQQTLPAFLQRNFLVDTVNLYRSHLTHTGSQYEVIAQQKSR